MIHEQFFFFKRLIINCPGAKIIRTEVLSCIWDVQHRVNEAKPYENNHKLHKNIMDSLYFGAVKYQQHTPGWIYEIIFL